MATSTHSPSYWLCMGTAWLSLSRWWLVRVVIVATGQMCVCVCVLGGVGTGQ